MSLAIKLLIDGVDRTSKLDERGWNIVSADGNAVDLMTFTCKDPDNTLVIERGKDVIVEKSTDANVRYFGGVVFRVHTVPVGLGREITITAQDWKIITDRSSFTASYTNQDDSAIIASGFTAAKLTEFDTTTLVDTIRTSIPRIVFKGNSVREMMDQLADMTVAVWGIDPFKRVFYHKLARVSSIAALSDNPDNSFTWPMQNPTRTEELGLYNSVEIRGTKRASADVTDTYSGDGSTVYFKLGMVDKHFIFKAPDGQSRVQIFVNTGTDATPIWTAQTVGIEDSDTLGGSIDVIINLTSQHLTFNVAPPNFATNSWQIKGKYLSAVLGLADDDAQIAIDGRKYTKSLNIGSIDTIDALQDMAEEFLNRNGPKDVIVLDTEYDTFWIGEVIEVTHSIFGITRGLYFIERMSLSLKGRDISNSRMTLQAVK